MYESIAMREMARSMASPSQMASWRFGERAIYDISGMDRSRDRRYTDSQAHVKARPTCTNVSYVIREILLHNINEHAVIEKQSQNTDDYILRPVALFDIAYRDLQECSSWPMDEAERMRYKRTMESCTKIFNRFYRGMSDEQIYMLNEAMEKMENAIKKDYDIMYIQIQEALRAGFANDQLRNYAAKLCVVHVCVDLPMKYMNACLGGTRIRDLEVVSKNVNLMMRYYASTDPSVDGDIDLNRSEMIVMALKAFQNKFFFVKMV